MKQIVFRELLILSKVEKAAQKASFSPTKNLILGENDVGKSTLIKSLYHTLGADVPQLDNSRWKQARPITLLKFSVGTEFFSIVRDESYFGIFDESGELISRYKGISKTGGVSEFINRILGFDIQLENSAGKMAKVPQAYFFLPFYIDQDTGWLQSWASFKGLHAFKKYRHFMIDYHLGIRPQEYYNKKRQLHESKSSLTELETGRKTLQDVRANYMERKSRLVVDLDASSFKEDIDQLLQTYNKHYALQKDTLLRIKQIREQISDLEAEVRVLEKSIRELNSDFEFVERTDTPSEINCPTCGSRFENSVAERFSIIDDADYCYALIDQRNKEMAQLRSDLSIHNNEYDSLSTQTNETSELLARKRGEVSFAELIASEGYKDVVATMSADIVDRTSEIDLTQDKLKHLTAETKVDGDRKKEIIEFYHGNMKSNLNKLNVQVLLESDYETPYKTIGNNALGSDLSRSILAQYFAFLSTMARFNKFICCPMVIDAPLQQEQDKSNTKLIFDFIFENLQKDQQLFVATLRESIDKPPDDMKVINPNRKLHLLENELYESVLNEVAPLHNLTLDYR